MLALEDAASYGPKSAMVLFKPVDKHGSEVADKSVMTIPRFRNMISEMVFRDRPVYRDEGERMSIMARSL